MPYPLLPPDCGEIEVATSMLHSFYMFIAATAPHDAKRFRHALFDALDALQPGETMRSCDDHDPVSLLSQLATYFGSRLEMAYVSREPGEAVIAFVVMR